MAPVLDQNLQNSSPTTDFELDNEAQILLFMVVFSTLAVVAVGLRIASKLMQWSRVRWDDILLLAAILQMLAMNILFLLATKYGGFGRNISEVSHDEFVFFMKSYFVAGLIMPTCYATAKLSMLWLLHTLFAFRNFQKVIRFLAIIVGLWWLATVLLDTFICFPINARWDPTVKGTCNNKVIQVEYFATPIPWIITDFAILVAPLPILWAMNVSRARQIGLVLLFGIGITTCGVACKRYMTLLDIDDKNLTSSMVQPCIWTMIESSTTIVCAALPASTIALKRILPTTHFARFVDFLDDYIYEWRHKDTLARWLEGSQTVRGPSNSPAANISTHRLNITPL
ncbi:hypothetical protein P154DRAFT_474170 [Amniculicola lignicola CBS 123094]|uniref:Rhodopsin domain-containing protein n=1 Tax=Amniculicola lignicola CBS 123094 TaxID=1392246 RepID=A0A6A5W399_9PLEO|nr:hypothetical protein P154DRAFT_474170 [Amniculicola lignicola CBS 123094]